jgi:hypothetical protein
MTHDEIAAQNIAERYLLGKLLSDDCMQFEEHFVDCPECLDRLESGERFQAALKPLASEILRSPIARVGRRGWPRGAWLVAAALVLSIGVSVLLAIRGLQIQRELERSRISSLGWQRRYERERAVPTTPPHAGPAGDAAALGPLVVSNFYLNTTRGGDSETSAPANRVTVTSDTNWVVLSLEGELEPGFQSLRVTLTDPASKDIWQKTGLSATPHQAFSVILPASMLKSGNHFLTLEGLSSTGHYSVMARYRFRVVTP